MASVRPRVGVVLVAAGGAAGALARWGVGRLAADPLGTLAVNVAGSFLLAALTARRPSEPTRLFAATGFCSSFTTYSAFAVETLSLGAVGGTAYLLVTYLLGLAAAAAGVRAGHTGGDA